MRWIFYLILATAVVVVILFAKCANEPVEREAYKKINKIPQSLVEDAVLNNSPDGSKIVETKDGFNAVSPDGQVIIRAVRRNEGNGWYLLGDPDLARRAFDELKPFYSKNR